MNFLSPTLSAFKTSGSGLSSQQLETLSRVAVSETSAIVAYVELLLEWNKKMDLIAPARTEVVFEKHVLDSLVSWQLISDKFYELKGPAPASVLDIGSGAGIPGILIAIVSRETSVTLLEPRTKRVHFLNEVRRRLELENLRVLEGRLEDLPSSPSEMFSLAVSRAIKIEGALVSALCRILQNGGVYAQLAGESFAALPDGAAFFEPISLPYALPSDNSGRQVVFHVKH